MNRKNRICGIPGYKGLEMLGEFLPVSDPLWVLDARGMMDGEMGKHLKIRSGGWGIAEWKEAHSMI
jgi:hypothetical protein